MALRGRQFKVSHTIDNNEIGLSLCGKLLPYKGASDPTPWDMGGGHVAHWDDDPYPDGYRPCGDCGTAFDKHVSEIDARNAESAKRYEAGDYSQRMVWR